MKLLCLGDIHLGRQPSRLSGEVIDQLAGRMPGPAAAWRRSVDYALEQGVDAVLLAGDVVEQEDDFYEAYRDLRAGVERLAAGGVQVLAVAGNHDMKVLPRLAEAVPGFRLLGAGGEWEAATVAGGSGQQVRVVGWSFPEPVVRTSPLAGGLPAREPLPTVGLLHCDRDQPGSHHAPVSHTELEAAPVDAWLLGHIHKPDALTGPRPVGYLGSVTGLDPGEPGDHGPWLLTVGPDGSLAIEQIPLAPLRWEVLEVAVDELADAGELQPRITEALDGLAARLDEIVPGPDVVGVRLRLTGRTSLRAALERRLAADDPRQAPHNRDERVFFVHDWQLATQPAVDLEARARQADPVGLVARRLLLLRGGDGPERRELVRSTRERLADIPRQSIFAGLGAEPPDDEATAAYLEAAALRILDDLLAQEDESP